MDALMQTGWGPADPPRRRPFPRVRPLVGPRGAAETASRLLLAGEAPVAWGRGREGAGLHWTLPPPD